MRRSKYNYLVAKRRYIDARRRYMDDEVEGKISKVQSLIGKVKGKLMAAADDPKVQRLLGILKKIGVVLGIVGGGAGAAVLGTKAGLRIAALTSIAKEGDGIVKMLSSSTVRDLIGSGALYACSAIFGLVLSIASIVKARSMSDSAKKLRYKTRKDALALYRDDEQGFIKKKILKLKELIGKVNDKLSAYAGSERGRKVMKYLSGIGAILNACMSATYVAELGSYSAKLKMLADRGIAETYFLEKEMNIGNFLKTALLAIFHGALSLVGAWAVGTEYNN